MPLVGLSHTMQFYQLFTIFVSRQQYIFPVFFILMTWKTKDLYIVAFNKMKELLPNFLPVHDFIRWLNSSNSDTTSDCVSLYRYSLVLVTNLHINRFCWCGNLYFIMILQWDIKNCRFCLAVLIFFDKDLIVPHRGQPPWCGGGAQHRWPERFLKSGGEEQLRADQIRVGRLLHDSSALVLVSASQPTTAL